MKRKPTLIIVAIIIVLIAGIVFFVKSRNKVTRAGDMDVAEFLDKFNNSIKTGNTDALLSCFAPDVNIRSLKKFANLLAGKKDKDGNPPLTSIKLQLDQYQTIDGAPGITVITIPIILSHGYLAEKPSQLQLKVGKTRDGTLKILQADVRKFVADYDAYNNFVRSSTIPLEKRFKPITLAAFKVANQLKSKYDSVIWFQHIDDKSYFYVVKGQWDRFSVDSLGDAGFTLKYKMGLVGPDQKEIIPVNYDLIHNISGTVDGLVEVEKDLKKGFYDLTGKNVVPVDYDQVFPLTDSTNIALMRKGDEYFYLKKDLSTTDKLADFKIADVYTKIKNFGTSYTWSDSTFRSVMEYNSLTDYNSIIVPPSYLVDLRILPHIIDFQNPLRGIASAGDEAEDLGDGDGENTYTVSFDDKNKSSGNWFETAFYSIVDDYLGGRSGLYEAKNVLLIDKKQNRLLGFNASSYYGGAEGGDVTSVCNENYLRAINDTLFEFKTTSILEAELLNGGLLNEGPYFHYLHIVNGKLVELPCQRLFACTKFVKLDDSYLAGCYTIDKNSYDHMTPEILSYMKNEIFASYNYKFNNPKWEEAFQGRFGREEAGKNTNVDDSLTAIDKYNINWINNKINSLKSNKLAVR